MIDYPREDVVVLGSGLTGSMAALELARNGKCVSLIEQDALAFNRASLRNEGKIHLGMVYAADKSLSTAKLMLDGALSFRRLVTQALKGQTDALLFSTPFFYLVANESLLTPPQLNQSYDAVQSLYLDRLSDDPKIDYLARRPPRIFRPVELDSLSSRFCVDFLLGAFQTEELAIDTDRLAQALRTAISNEPYIRLRGGHKLQAVERTSSGFRIEGQGPS